MNEIFPAMTFSLAQTNDAPAPSGSGGAGAPSGTTEGTAADPSAPAQKSDGLFGGGMNSILIMILMFVVFYFLLIRPQQKKAKEHQKMIESIGKGVEIVTNGGLVGRVTGVADKTLTVEISEKVRVRVLRTQVAGLFNAVDNAEKK